MGLPQDFLLEDGSNLGLILNGLRDYTDSRDKIREMLQTLSPSFEDFGVRISDQSVQIMIQETGLSEALPAVRLSDGTIRFLCLLAVLCHPKPPPVICIEEPELGLHPDVLQPIARLLIEASRRTQLIVTTHSDFLVNALTDVPEAIVVCDRVEGSTVMSRPAPEQLAVWLEDYSLGELWMKGQLGGTRW